MKYRNVTIFSGEKFVVPQGIQRIDTRATHGWQVRYQGTKMFSDHSSDGSGARKAFEAATKELLQRMANLPAPVTLQRGPSATKSSELPPGISGPIVRARSGASVRTAAFSVLLPRFGQPPKCTTIYIGNEKTYNVQRYKEALARAVQMRQQAEAEYAEAATKAKRKDIAEIRAVLKEGKAPRGSLRKARAGA
jgi:hypothetical protein